MHVLQRGVVSDRDHPSCTCASDHQSLSMCEWSGVDGQVRRCCHSHDGRSELRNRRRTYLLSCALILNHVQCTLVLALEPCKCGHTPCFLVSINFHAEFCTATSVHTSLARESPIAGSSSTGGVPSFVHVVRNHGNAPHSWARPHINVNGDSELHAAHATTMVCLADVSTFDVCLCLIERHKFPPAQQLGRLFAERTDITFCCSAIRMSRAHSLNTKHTVCQARDLGREKKRACHHRSHHGPECSPSASATEAALPCPGLERQHD